MMQVYALVYLDGKARSRHPLAEPGTGISAQQGVL